MNCQNCGAPLKAEDELCEYCGTMTQYGMTMLEERKRLEREEHRRHALENLPKFKYVPMPMVIALCILTLGCYAPYWYITRTASLKSLTDSKNFPVWAAVIFVIAWGLVVILPSGEENPSELLQSGRMSNMVKQLKEVFDMVIFDGTPCNVVTDSLILSRIVDSVAIVVAYKETKTDVLKATIKSIKNVDGKIAGVIFNKVPNRNDKYYNYTYK